MENEARRAVKVIFIPYVQKTVRAVRTPQEPDFETSKAVVGRVLNFLGPADGEIRIITDRRLEGRSLVLTLSEHFPSAEVLAYPWMAPVRIKTQPAGQTAPQFESIFHALRSMDTEVLFMVLSTTMIKPYLGQVMTFLGLKTVKVLPAALARSAVILNTQDKDPLRIVSW